MGATCAHVARLRRGPRCVRRRARGLIVRVRGGHVPGVAAPGCVTAPVPLGACCCGVVAPRTHTRHKRALFCDAYGAELTLA